MHSIADYLANASDRRLSRTEGPHRRTRTFGTTQLHNRAETFDGAWTQFERSTFANQLAAFGIVAIGKECLDRHLHEIRIAVEAFAIGVGELGAFNLQMDEIGTGRIKAIEVTAFQQRQLLQQHGPLAPDARFAYRVTAIIVRERRLDARLPHSHVGTGD